MIETKFGLKYPFPHTLVHIVDNSSYTGDLPVVVADEPSMYGTIVVTGSPIGEDRRVIDITRSDVLRVAFGMDAVGTGDIRKYGQTITYPMALINQGGPVKLLRVTPDDCQIQHRTFQRQPRRLPESGTSERCNCESICKCNDTEA